MKSNQVIPDATARAIINVIIFLNTVLTLYALLTYQPHHQYPSQNYFDELLFQTIRYSFMMVVLNFAIIITMIIALKGDSMNIFQQSFFTRIILGLIDATIQSPTQRVIIKSVMFAAFVVFLMGFGSMLEKSIGFVWMMITIAGLGLGCEFAAYLWIQKK